MADHNLPGPIGKDSGGVCSIKDGTSIRRFSPQPGTVGKGGRDTTVENDVLGRIKKWRNFAESSGMFPNAVAAMDHYLNRTGTFVVIPSSKVKSVRKESGFSHMEKSRKIFKSVALMEAGATWLGKRGFPAKGGALSPKQIEFILTYQTGESSPGLTDDNLTYFGSQIMSEVKFKAEQISFPESTENESFSVKISVINWTSWVVDNYDWEGDKQFGFFTAFGLPSQKEMNSLHNAGLAKSYQRSSNSWEVTNHGLAPWTESTIYSIRIFKEVSESRQTSNQNRELSRKKEQKQGALPTPGPAEDEIE